PQNTDIPPVSAGEEEKEQLSPKVGLEWQATDSTHLRASYTRSLGGVFFDNSVRLEPTQVGGFNQAFRSLIPESVVGLVPGTEFETISAGIDHRTKHNTYLGLEGHWLLSSADRRVGVLTNSTFIPVPDRASSTHQTLDFEEKTLVGTLNQLIGEHWTIGGTYRLSWADLNGRFNEVSASVPGASLINQNQDAMLQQV